MCRIIADEIKALKKKAKVVKGRHLVEAYE
jgi:hypothetical protein